MRRTKHFHYHLQGRNQMRTNRVGGLHESEKKVEVAARDGGIGEVIIATKTVPGWPER